MARALKRLVLGLAAAAVIAGAAAAQGAGPSLGDVRADLGVLDRQIRELRAALVASGPGRGLPTAPATALTRLDQLEAELRRLTSRVDVLTNDVERIAADATNRVGDLEFRLTELEGGDVSLLGKPEPLGGGVTPAAPAAPAPLAPQAPAAGAELAVSERADFDAATAAAAAGDNAEAARLFEAFLATYPGGPLSAEAQFRRGEALARDRRVARRRAQLSRRVQRRAGGPVRAAGAAAARRRARPDRADQRGLPDADRGGDPLSRAPTRLARLPAQRAALGCP